MERVTIFGDIHGNLPAWDAVLADIETHDTSPLYCLGDLVGYVSLPNEVIHTIRERKIPTVRGNNDQGVGNSSDNCRCDNTRKTAEAQGKRSINYTKQNTTTENKLSLKQLPAHIPLQIDELRVLR